MSYVSSTNCTPPDPPTDGDQRTREPLSLAIRERREDSQGHGEPETQNRTSTTSAAVGSTREDLDKAEKRANRRHNRQWKRQPFPHKKFRRTSQPEVARSVVAAASQTTSSRRRSKPFPREKFRPTRSMPTTGPTPTSASTHPDRSATTSGPMHSTSTHDYIIDVEDDQGESQDTSYGAVATVETSTVRPPPSQVDHNMESQHETHLIEASLVPEPSMDDIPQAEIVEQQDKEVPPFLTRIIPNPTIRALLCFGMVLVVAGVAVIGIFCSGGSCGVNNNSKDASDAEMPTTVSETEPTTSSSILPTTPPPTDVEPTSKPTTAPVLEIPPTEIPTTVSPTTNEPTGMPTPTPASLLLGTSESTIELPGYTIQAMTNKTSAQSKAFIWLSTSYDNNTLQTMPEWRKQQLFAMASTYYSLNGDDWHANDKQNWLNASLSECEQWTPNEQCPTCNWDTFIQIRCLESGQLYSLRLDFFDNNALRGTLPPEIELIPSLQNLTIMSSHWEGNLALVLPVTKLGNLPNLHYLSVAANYDLSGTIPTELGLLTELTRLGLNTNQLTGTIPSELGLLSQLRLLFLSDNRITGTIPTELGLLSELTQLGFGDNSLSGNMPQQVCLLQEQHGLIYLDVDVLEVSCPSDCSCQAPYGSG